MFKIIIKKNYFSSFLTKRETKLKYEIFVGLVPVSLIKKKNRFIISPLFYEIYQWVNPLRMVILFCKKKRIKYL